MTTTLTLYCAHNIPPFLTPELVRDLRILWAAEEAGLDYRIHWLNTMQGEQREPAYRAINPFGKIPAMTDGEFALAESGAIVTYLLDKSDGLIPAPGTPARSVYEQWCFAALNTVEPPLFDLMVASLAYKDAAWTKERLPVLRELAGARLAALDAVLKGRAYLANDAFSGADILMGQVLGFVVDKSLLEPVPHVRAYVERLYARPAYRRARAKQAAGPETAAA